jgi:hypothetical protein
MFGSGLTIPFGESQFGVPGAEGMVRMVRSELSKAERSVLDKKLGIAGIDRYQTAMEFLERTKGRKSVRDLVARSVLSAFRRDHLGLVLDSLHLQSGQKLTIDMINASTEEVPDSWVLSPAVESFGKLIMICGYRFGKDIFTTNFDPLIGVSIRRAGGSYFRVALAEDGNLRGIAGSVPRIIHLHGFYHGTDNLHTSAQLRAKRPFLQVSLMHLLRERILVVMGYGGWNDIFMRALTRAVRKDGVREVLWTFRANDEDDIFTKYRHVIRALAPAVERGKAHFFKGVDINEFIPRLYVACGYQSLISRKMLEVYLHLQFGCANEEDSKWIKIFGVTFPTWRTLVAHDYELEPGIRKLKNYFQKQLKNLKINPSAEQLGLSLNDFVDELIHRQLGPWVIPPSGLPDLEDT